MNKDKLKTLNHNLVLGYDPKTANDHQQEIVDDAASIFRTFLEIAYTDLGLEYVLPELEAYALEIMEQVIEGTAQMPANRKELMIWAKQDAMNRCNYAFA